MNEVEAGMSMLGTSSSGKGFIKLFYSVLFI